MLKNYERLHNCIQKVYINIQDKQLRAVGRLYFKYRLLHSVLTTSDHTSDKLYTEVIHAIHIEFVMYYVRNICTS